MVYDLHSNDITSEPKRLDSVFPRARFLGRSSLSSTLIHPSQIVLDSRLDLHKFSGDTQLFNSSPPADFNLVSKQTERCADHVRV